MAKRKKKTEPISVDALVDLLSLVGRTVPREAVAAWSPEKREAAGDWAAREHLRASDNTTVRRKKEPDHVWHACVEKYQPAPGDCPKSTIFDSSLSGHRMQRRFVGELHIVDCANCGALSPDSD